MKCQGLRCDWFPRAIVVLATACGLDQTVLRDLSGDELARNDAGAGDGAAPEGGGFDDAVAPAGDAFGVFLGQTFSCALASGRAFCWGSNLLGALGTGDTQSRLSPTPVAGNITFEALSAGENHACGLERSTGRVFCWGYGASGQLGQGNQETRYAPTLVSLPGPAAQITSGYNHVCAVLRNGELHCWGDNDEGQIGLADTFGAPDVLSPARVGIESDWRFVAAGQGHTCGARQPGNLWCWGRNTAGHLGLGVGAPGQVRLPTRVGSATDFGTLDLGQDQGCSVSAGGALRAWGSGTFGNLDGTGNDLYVPTQIGADTNWATISTDVFTTCGLRSPDKLYCWGRNVEGQLGVGDTTDRTTPTESGIGRAWASVSVGRFHICAMTTDHQVACSGANESGQLGLGDTQRKATLTTVVLPGVATR